MRERLDFEVADLEHDDGVLAMLGLDDLGQLPCRRSRALASVR